MLARYCSWVDIFIFERNVLLKSLIMEFQADDGILGQLISTHPF